MKCVEILFVFFKECLFSLGSGRWKSPSSGHRIWDSIVSRVDVSSVSEQLRRVGSSPNGPQRQTKRAIIRKCFGFLGSFFSAYGESFRPGWLRALSVWRRSPKNTNLTAWGAPTCLDSAEKRPSVGWGGGGLKITVWIFSGGEDEVIPSLLSKMAPRRPDLHVSRPFGTGAVISVKVSFRLLPSPYFLSPLSALHCLHHIFLFSQSSSLFSPRPSPVCSLAAFLSAMRPRCQSWLFWFESTTCGWNLRPAPLPSHRPGNGAAALENKALFSARSVDEWKEGEISESVRSAASGVKGERRNLVVNPTPGSSGGRAHLGVICRRRMQRC